MGSRLCWRCEYSQPQSSQPGSVEDRVRGKQRHSTLKVGDAAQTRITCNHLTYHCFNQFHLTRKLNNGPPMSQRETIRFQQTAVDNCDLVSIHQSWMYTFQIVLSIPFSLVILQFLESQDLIPFLKQEWQTVNRSQWAALSEELRMDSWMDIWVG